jgi:hypothetical protein
MKLAVVIAFFYKQFYAENYRSLIWYPINIQHTLPNDHDVVGCDAVQPGRSSPTLLIEVLKTTSGCKG